MYFLGVQPGDVHLNISSPGWAKHAWSCFFAPWIGEATIFIYNYARFDAAALLTQLRERQVSSFCAPPTVWRMLIGADLGERPAALREAIGAGEPLNPEVIGRVQRAWGLTIRDGFGQTETTAQVANTPGEEIKIGSMGRPLPGVPVAIVDPATGQPLTGPGEGEICLDLARQPLALMKGYQGDPERTAEATAGGYYHTGDMATIDGDGYIFYVGRTDDVFKASDYKISPFELESVLIEHHAVAEAAVVPAPDPVRLAVPRPKSPSPPGTSRPGKPRLPSSATPVSGSTPTSGCGASSSPSCPRPSPARSAASSCAPARNRPRRRKPHQKNGEMISSPNSRADSCLGACRKGRRRGWFAGYGCDPGGDWLPAGIEPHACCLRDRQNRFTAADRRR
jgi:acyl-CoA synthetase (AMP-forming)/AMP-acid ligase II